MECCCCGDSGDRIFCCGPNRHAICRQCFPLYVSARGTGPFQDLTVAESTMLRCPMDRSPLCRLPTPCPDPWARSFFAAEDVVQKGFMTAGQLDRLKETSRRAQLLMQDDGLKLETMERLMPILREYRAMCSRIHELWDAERDAGGEDEAYAAKKSVDDTEKEIRRLHSALVRTPMNTISGTDESTRLTSRLMRCWSCASGLYYIPGGTCLVCEAKHCIKCGEVSTETHACDEYDASSFAEVVRTTQTCPNCRSMVQKAEGCDQMFCTQCNTPFSYRTGERVTEGVLHNPHFLALPEAERAHLRELRLSGGCDDGDIEAALEAAGAPQDVMRAWWFLGHVRDTLPDDRNSVEHYDFELANRIQRLSAIIGERITSPPVRGKPKAVPKEYKNSDRIAHLLLTQTKHRRRTELFALHTEYESIALDLFAHLSEITNAAEAKNVYTMINAVWTSLVEKSAPYGDFKHSVSKWLSAEIKTAAAKEG